MPSWNIRITARKLFRRTYTDDFIVESATAGPNKGYKTAKGKVECKVRGFSLTARGRKQLSYDISEKNIQEEINLPQPLLLEIPVWNPHKIVRGIKDKHLHSQSETRRYISTGV